MNYYKFKLNYYDICLWILVQCCLENQENLETLVYRSGLGLLVWFTGWVYGSGILTCWTYVGALHAPKPVNMFGAPKPVNMKFEFKIFVKIALINEIFFKLLNISLIIIEFSFILIILESQLIIVFFDNY